jgi:hypothetical protein
MDISMEAFDGEFLDEGGESFYDIEDISEIKWAISFSLFREPSWRLEQPRLQKHHKRKQKQARQSPPISIDIDRIYPLLLLLLAPSMKSRDHSSEPSRLRMPLLGAYRRSWAMRLLQQSRQQTTTSPIQI